MVTIKKSHFQEEEPILEGFLSNFRFNKIIKYISENSKVLDMGCGYNCRFLRKIEERIACGVGIDVSVSKEDFGSKIKLVNCDLNRMLPFENGEFDVVVSLANLEHLENPTKNAKEIFRVLKPGGLLLLTSPSIYAKPVLEFLAFKLKLVNTEEIMDHKNYFNKSVLFDILKKAGFSYIKHNYFQLFMNNFIYARK